MGAMAQKLSAIEVKLSRKVGEQNKLFGSVVVKSDRSLTGRKVYLQKFTRFGQWVKIKGVILGRASHSYFRLKLAPGRYQLRIFMSFNQVGAGYLDGFSRTVTYTRK